MDVNVPSTSCCVCCKEIPLDVAFTSAGYGVRRALLRAGVLPEYCRPSDAVKAVNTNPTCSRHKSEAWTIAANWYMLRHTYNSKLTQHIAFSSKACPPGIFGDV